METPNSKQQQLTALQQQILQCRVCWDSFGFEPHPVVQGNHCAKIMQISQAPSKRVHETGKPFNDASGKKLREEWYGISEQEFYNPDFFYIVSMAHCYPGKSPGKGDRQPPKICAEKWLQNEMPLVENELTILIGAIAAKYFFPKEPFTALVFQEIEMNGKPAFVLPHPSPLNIKWFRDYPEFAKERLPAVRKAVHRALGLPQKPQSENR